MRLHFVRTVLVALALLLPAAAPRAQAPEDVRAAPSCKYCGMDREKFAASRMLVEYDDGSQVATCSLRCMAVELAVTLDRAPTAIKVGDRDTKKLIDAEKAVWVLGGDVPGVMTRNAKWAFAERAAADAFVKAHGGKVVTFDEAMKAAYQEMYDDSKMIREKRKAARAKGGHHH